MEFHSRIPPLRLSKQRKLLIRSRVCVCVCVKQSLIKSRSGGCETATVCVWVGGGGGGFGGGGAPKVKCLLLLSCTAVQNWDFQNSLSNVRGDGNGVGVGVNLKKMFWHKKEKEKKKGVISSVNSLLNMFTVSVTGTLLADASIIPVVQDPRVILVAKERCWKTTSHPPPPKKRKKKGETCWHILQKERLNVSIRLRGVRIPELYQLQKKGVEPPPPPPKKKRRKKKGKTCWHILLKERLNVKVDTHKNSSFVFWFILFCPVCNAVTYLWNICQHITAIE